MRKVSHSWSLLSQVRYESGYSPYLEVLDAQRTANDAEGRRMAAVIPVTVMLQAGRGE